MSSTSHNNSPVAQPHAPAGVLAAWRDGRLVDPCQSALSVDDLGVMQGVIGVERLRTWHGRCPLLARHLARLQTTTEALGIDVNSQPSDWQAAIELLFATQPADGQDFSVTLLITPGVAGANQPTRLALLHPIDQQRASRLNEGGQPLFVSAIEQPSPNCWPRAIKVRTRLHYYLADKAARDQHPEALAVLLDQDGTITETSTSNVHLVAGNSMVLPPEDCVLPGVMSAVLVDLMKAAGWSIERRPIAVDELQQADEVWLTGSLVGLWFANAIEGKPIQASPSDQLRYWQQQLYSHLGN